MGKFEKNVRLKSLGAWGVYLQKGLPVYSGDKFFTEDGTATLLFYDGSSLEIMPYSIVRVVEYQSQKGRRLVQRDIRVFLGKIKYEAGESSRAKTKLIFPTALLKFKEERAETAKEKTATPYIVCSYLPEIPPSVSESTESSAIETLLKYDVIFYAEDMQVESVGKNIKKADAPGQVPEVIHEKAENDPNYKVVSHAVLVGSEYLRTKLQVEQKNAEYIPPKYEANARTDHALEYITEEDRDKAIDYVQGTFDARFEHMGNLGDMTLANLNENIMENISLSETPDKGAAKNAREALEKGMADRKMLENIYALMEKDKKELKSVKEQCDKAEGEREKRVLFDLLVGMDQNISSFDKGMYRQGLLNEAYTVGTPTLKQDAEELIKFGNQVVPFAGSLLTDSLKSYVSDVLQSEGKSLAQYSSGVLWADLTSDMILAQSGGTQGQNDEIIKKKLVMIHIIITTISSYAGVNNILVNAHEESLADMGIDFSFEDMLAAIETWIKEIFDLYNVSLAEFDSLSIEDLNANLNSIIEKLKRVESTARMFQDFIKDLFRTSSVLSPAVFGTWYNARDLWGNLCDILCGEGKCEETRCTKCVNGVPVVDYGRPCDDGDPCTVNDYCCGPNNCCGGRRVVSAEDPRCK